MKIRRAFCFFEQSGTFRDEFRKLGVPADDYDIENSFGKTDHVIDLFAEIREAYAGFPSVFDEVGPEDLIMAFFPCVRFSEQTKLLFTCNNNEMRKWDQLRRMENDIQLHNELHDLYCLISELCIVVLKKELRMIIENPYSNSKQHYLTNYWGIKPAVVDLDRTENGDYHKKPTQYWFVGCSPEQNFVFEPIEYCAPRVVDKVKGMDGYDRQTVRSLIHPQYARRFIKMYLVDQLPIVT